MKYKAIIFDFGGVILKHKATIVTDILSEIFPQNFDKVFEVWRKYEPLLKTGKKTSEDFFSELKNTIHTNLNFDEFRGLWMDLYTKEAHDVDWELLDFIEKLKEKYQVYLFTDTIDIHDEYNKTRGIYDTFHKVYKSFEEGVAKIQGKDAFIYLLNKIHAKPQRCVFIDDVESYVKIAQSLGMKGILYKNLSMLKKDLALNGVKV